MILPAAVIIAPSPVAIMPTENKSGPMAAVTSARIVAHFSSPGENVAMTSTSPVNPLTRSVAHSSRPLLPMVIARSSREPMSCFIWPLKPAMRASASLLALTLEIAASMRVRPSSPCFMSPMAVRIASVPKSSPSTSCLAWSDRCPIFRRSSSAISAIGRSLPLASKKRSPNFSMTPAAFSVSGESRCRKVLNAVPASEPDANWLAVPASAVLKSSNDTPSAAAMPPA